MKKSFIWAALVLGVLSTVNSQISTLHAQGALTPSGAPAPVMKTLAQIEPRTPISAVPFTISASGSYYLTTNVTVSSGNAIYITANNVTLDLGGFTIASTQPAASVESAILFNGSRTNIFIHDGHISSGVTNTAGGVYSGSGFANGIFVPIYSYNVRVKDVSVSGVLVMGINLSFGSSTVVESCTANVAGSVGLLADSIFNSTSETCGYYGIYAITAANCRGIGVGSGGGVFATIANNCYGYSYGSGAGLAVSDVATGCSGYSNSGTGISAFIANGCRGTTTSGAGLSVTHNVNSF